MKNIKKYVAIACVFAAISSCNKDDLEAINANPNAPSSVQPINLLPSIQASMALGIQFDGRCLGKYVQNFSHITATTSGISTTSTATNWDRYGHDQVIGTSTAADVGGEIWKMAYYSIGKNLSDVMTTSEKDKKHDILGIAKVIRGWSWQIATDYHSELIKFDQVFTNRLTFDYGTQQEAYAEVKRLALEGIADLARIDGTSSQSYTAKGDLIYAGDKTKWTKFAYGLLARNAHNLSNKAGYNPDEVIAFVDKSFTGIADDCYVKFTGTSSADTNFWGPLRGNMNSFRQTDFIVNAMSGDVVTGVFPGMQDPRMQAILAPSQDGKFRGNPLNTVASTVALTKIPNLYGSVNSASLATPGRYLFRNSADFPLMTYAELQFIKAEAALKKGDNPLALSAYKLAIAASIDMVNRNTIVVATATLESPKTALITATEKTSFLANVNVVPTVLTLKHILVQKYIALFGFGFIETWTDMRKQHYNNTTVYQGMVFPAALLDDNGGKLAYRVRPRYNSEYLWNRDALLAIGGFNADYHTVEMWFSKP